MPTDAQSLALTRRAAKIELYRRNYARFAAEQQYIRAKDATVRRLNLFPTQQMVEEAIHRQVKEFGWIRVMEFKARQHGGSTHGVSRACHRVFLNENVSALILAQDDATASNLFDMAQLMYQSMDKEIKPVRRYLNKQEIVLENPDPKTRSDLPGLGSRIAIQSAKNMHAAVGTTRNWVHICLDPETLVITDNGSIVPINKVPVGATVMTHSGHRATVSALSIRPAAEVTEHGETLKVSCWNTYAPLVVTPRHRVWTDRGWVEARDLRISDHIGVPRRQITNNIPALILPPKINSPHRRRGIEGQVPVNRETGFFFGYYLAEGSIRPSPHGVGEIRLTRHENEQRFADRAVAAVESWIHSASTAVPRNPVNKARTTRIYGNSLARLVQSEFGEKNEKRIPDWVFDTGAQFLEGLLVGYAAGDGSKAPDGPNARVVSITSIRPSLLIQLRNILAAIGWGWASLHQIRASECKDKRGWNNQPAWCLQICGDAAQRIRKELGLQVHARTHQWTYKYKIDQQWVWTKIRKIEEWHSRDVCDLEVDHEDHSFETIVGAVANSEMCRYGNVKELMGSLVPAIPLIPGTAVINESAPFGYGEGRDAFRAACDAARNGNSPYHFVGIYWWMCPEYFLPLTKHDLLNGRFLTTAEERRIIKRVQQVSKKELGREITLTNEQLKYRRIRIQELSPGDEAIGEILFKQQYPSDYEEGWVQFLNLIFDTLSLEKMKRMQERGPLRRCDIIGDEVIDPPNGTHAPLWIWEDPLPGEMYDMGVDSAAGTGGNYSAFQVFKRSNNEQVAEYRNNKIGPLDYAKVVYSVGLYYNAAHCIVEVEGIGYAVNEALNQSGYPNIYRWRKRDQAGSILSPLTGWKTQYDTKRLLVAVGQDVVAHDSVILHSSRLYNELRYFCQDFSDSGNEVFYASEGDDDLCLAFLIAQVGMRDEKFIELPLERGAQLARTGTLAERNKRLQEGIERQMAFNDTPDKDMAPQLPHADMRGYREKGYEGLPVRGLSEDPWLRFERAVKNEEE